jgi:predicted Rossmann fold nucleotide-binding protein DprA/Smf involved in DNA uptake
MIKKIISGGQTGADQAGLDAAIKHNIPHGGSIPKGRMTEDGVLPEKYNLTKMATKSYPKRTEKNVVDSDGTVIFTHGELAGGSLLTQKKAIEHGKPVIHIDLKALDSGEAVTALLQFVKKNNVEVLNVAGSRASKDERIYGAVFEIVGNVL